MNPGDALIEFLTRKMLQIDAEWSTPLERGIRWWPHQQAQTIEVIGDETNEQGEVASLVRVRTEMLENFTLDAHSASAIHATLMDRPAMSGPVHDAEGRTLSLASLVRVHNGIIRWLSPMVGHAAALQIHEARRIGPELAARTGATVATGGPPGRSPRPQPDELTHVVEQMVLPAEDRPCRWTREEFEGALGVMQSVPGLFANGGGSGCTVNLPIGELLPSLSVMESGWHPRYGNGLALRDKFPVPTAVDLAGIELALRLNHTELTTKPLGYGIGSYGIRDGMLAFQSFVPNAFHIPGVLPNFFLASRARGPQVFAALPEGRWP